MREIAIFGAGVRGKELYRLLYRYRFDVKCFVDNNTEKQGKDIWGVPIISLDEYINEYRECELIISVQDSAGIEKQLKKVNIEYSFFKQNENSFFLRKNVRQYIDLVLLQDFLVTEFDVNSIFEDQENNWYRTQYYNSFNETLIREMKDGVENVLSLDIYDKIYPDEYYDGRCDMHLVHNLIIRYCKQDDTIMDIGAGHGFFLDELRKKNYTKLVACEGSPVRRQYLMAKKYTTVMNRAENLQDMDTESVDAIVCMETLEHVRDTKKSVEEIARVLKPGGYCWITVPEGALCDCQTHVRHFTINSLACLFHKHGFAIMNVQNIPDSYFRAQGHILLQGKKEGRK